MCTVTIVPCDDGFRLACNRDERHDRSPAIGPTAHRLGDRTAVFPVDPVGGGTWTGVNDRGLAAALLNRMAAAGTPSPMTAERSRGLIVPIVLGCASLSEALDAVAGIQPGSFAAFRVVLVQRMAVAVVTSDRRRLVVETGSPSEPLMWTSSSLGDEVVDGPRRALFELRVRGRERPVWVKAQSRFHMHQWPGREDVSVLMERSDARTVSQTFVRVTSEAWRLRYRSLNRPGSVDVEAA